MLLVIDVGNTNITVAVYQNKENKGSFRLRTKTERTSDEYGVILVNLLKEREVEKSMIEDVIISSVVPNLMYSLRNAIYKYFGVNPMIVEPGLKTGISIHTDNPKEVGADRIVDAVAAYNEYGGPVLIIDFGTATTYDLISEKGVFEAGITSPGIRISADALWTQAAKLPEIQIEKPKSILAKNTITSMQAGLVYGYIGQVEYIIEKVKEETGIKDLKVVATGGLGRIIAGETDKIDIYDPDLSFKGLYYIYEKNKANRDGRKEWK
ncbi:type III pantothenate kinase [Clostridiales bacterium COT073_COT-073]|nr:type III pantothenate kinase [Clostridiales bacterium COT073_COT-073]